ncbi:ABC transporter permease [Streptomyces olivaceiscleroticus]|uniref:ABC transporter permease n=1 Tax=Streptomyces olivaceiscleroticus TaxID=68245 RepID=A0ABP3JKN0_9ACTN
MIDYIRLEVRRTLRDKGFVIFGIGMPVVMYLLLTNLAGSSGKEAEAWKVTAMVGMASYGALGAALGTGNGLAEDKKLGWLRQLRITPLSPARVVVGRGLSASVTVLPAIIVVLLLGALVNGIHLAAWQWIGLVVLLWLGTTPFTLLGLGNGYRLSAQAAGMVNAGCMMVLAIIGGLWFPAAAFPGWLQEISRWTPSNRFADLGWSVTAGHGPSAGTVLVLVAWLAAFGAYAVYAYRRAARTA